jgi:hypothetical protein
MMGSRRAYSGLIGGLFLAGFLCYGVGNALATSVLGGPNYLAMISAQQTTLAFGVLLMLVNSMTVAGIGVVFFPILENHGKRTALTYLAARIAEAVLLASGALLLLLIVPLGQVAASTGATSAGWATALGALAVQANTNFYQVGEMALALGGVFLCPLLLRTGLVPRVLGSWGVIGYEVFLMGTIAEILGLHIGLVLSIPGGLWEFVFGCWLITKGFQPEAYESGSADDDLVAPELAISTAASPPGSAHASAAV